MELNEDMCFFTEVLPRTSGFFEINTRTTHACELEALSSSEKRGTEDIPSAAVGRVCHSVRTDHTFDTPGLVNTPLPFQSLNQEQTRGLVSHVYAWYPNANQDMAQASFCSPAYPGGIVIEQRSTPIICQYQREVPMHIQESYLNHTEGIHAGLPYFVPCNTVGPVDDALHCSESQQPEAMYRQVNPSGAESGQVANSFKFVDCYNDPKVSVSYSKKKSPRGKSNSQNMVDETQNPQLSMRSSIKFISVDGSAKKSRRKVKKAWNPDSVFCADTPNPEQSIREQHTKSYAPSSAALDIGMPKTAAPKRGRPANRSDPENGDYTVESHSVKAKRRRPINGFMAYVYHVRSILHQEGAEFNNKEFLREMSKKWKELPLDLQRKYREIGQNLTFSRDEDVEMGKRGCMPTKAPVQLDSCTEYEDIPNAFVWSPVKQTIKLGAPQGHRHSHNIRK